MRAGQRSRLRRPPRVSLRRRLLVAAAALLWIALVLYPNPLSFFGSLWRLADPPVEPGVVNSLVDKLPDDYPAVETFSREYVQYDNPWALYGEPWHFPTLDEVLADEAGDCQAEALLTASLLEAKGMPYVLRYSFNHVWVDYPGKMVSSLEDPATAFVSEADAGWFARLPERVPLRNIVETRLAFHWTPMPAGRKALLFLGLVSLVGFMEWPVLGRRTLRLPYGDRRADGAIRDCLRRDVPLAYTQELHARGGRLEDVFALTRYREMLAEAESCTACNNPDAIEMSWFWNLRPVSSTRAPSVTGIPASCSSSLPSCSKSRIRTPL